MITNNIHREELHRNVDDLLTGYYRDKLATLSELTPDKVAQIIEVDNHCLLSMGTNITNSSTNTYRCHNCTELGRLFDFRKGHQSVITLESGAFTGVNLSIKKNSNVIYDVKWDQRAKDRSEELDKAEGLNKCGLNTSGISKRYICSDSWLNELLINWSISEVLSNENIPHYRQIVKSFVCGGDGFQVRFGNMKSLMSIDQSLIDEDLVYSIFHQLASFLHHLQNYQFVHGTATIDKLYISSSACNYKFKDKGNEHLIVSSNTLVVDGFHLSSINWGETRIIPSINGRGVDLDRSISSFRPIISKCNLRKDLSIETCSNNSNSYLFRFGDSSSSLFTTMRYSGYPLFGGAFDVYSFMTSLMSWEPIRMIVNKSHRLTAIWHYLFPGELRDEITEHIPYSSTPITCSYKISGLLSNKWLFCDSIDRLLEACIIYKKI